MARGTPKGPAWADYCERVGSGLLPKLTASAVSILLYDGSGDDEEVMYATQLGYMLLLDKPLIVATPPGVTVPTRLARAADEIVELKLDDPASRETLMAAVRRLGERLGLEPDQP